jgi:hypothetical protein
VLGLDASREEKLRSFIPYLRQLARLHLDIAQRSTVNCKIKIDLESIAVQHPKNHALAATRYMARAHQLEQELQATQKQAKTTTVTPAISPLFPSQHSVWGP